MAVHLKYYATDEDIALRASADFHLLCPKDQNLAWGADGVFNVSDRWRLTSQTVDFLANGLAPGQIVRLTQPVALFKPPGDSLVVAGVAPNAVTLRRKGQPLGMGQPPGPLEGASQVEFAVTTLGPQIDRASYDLNRRFGIDDLLTGRRSSDLFDPREVREAAVLTVLYRQYLESSRGAEERVDSFALKSQRYQQELTDLLDRTVVHWTSNCGLTPPESTTRLSTRLSR
jgi:hypothetical protein